MWTHLFLAQVASYKSRLFIRFTPGFDLAQQVRSMNLLFRQASEISDNAHRVLVPAAGGRANWAAAFVYAAAEITGVPHSVVSRMSHIVHLRAKRMVKDYSCILSLAELIELIFGSVRGVMGYVSLLGLTFCST